MISLSVGDTMLATVPLLTAIAVVQWKLSHCREMIVAAARMVLQLVCVGYLLSFLFNYDWSVLGLVVMLFMSVAASIIAIRPIKNKSWRHFRSALTALLSASTLHLSWVILVVLKLSPWYQPQFVIPLAGMIFANGMNSLSLGAERFESELEHKSPKAAASAAFTAAMIPQVNSLLAVGLVSLPGMMTGQILSGVSPLEAVRYQILVMSMVTGNAALTLAVYFLLISRVRRA